MANCGGRGPPLPSGAPLRWQTGLANDYTFRDNQKGYNFRTHVPWDRDWGRGDGNTWGVAWGAPYNIVDERYTPQYLINMRATDYRFLPYFDPTQVRHVDPSRFGTSHGL